MPSDSFTDALERLDPASRALLDLSLRRGMQTDEIAEVLGAEPESVAASRDDALQRVAADVGMDGDEQLDTVRARLAELPAEQWIGRPAAPEEPEAPAPRSEPSATPPEPDRRGTRRLAILLALLLLAGAIAAFLLARGSDDSAPANTTAAKAPPAQPQPPPRAKPQPQGVRAPLGAMGGARASGAATRSGKQLVVNVSGLPKGSYSVWLYNSVIDSRSIGSANGPRIAVRARLPRGWRHYRFVDVSREPSDGNPGHSGQSVARVPTARLSR